MDRPSADKIAFVLCSILLAFLFGYGVRRFSWAPDAFLDTAIHQAYRFVSEPHYLAPRVYERGDVRTLDPEAVQPGLTLIVTRWPDFDWMPGLRLVDREGRVLHEWEIRPSRFFIGPDRWQLDSSIRSVDDRNVHGVHLFPNGDVLANVSYVGLVRLDACGSPLWHSEQGQHHSVARAEDGTFWIPGISPDPIVPRSGRGDRLPGIDVPVYRDLLLNVTGAGELIDRLDVLDLLYENGLERYLFKLDRNRFVDITHLNDVEPLSAAMADEYPLFEAGDLLVSLRDVDLVFVVDPDNRVVKWHAMDPFVAQHDPDYMGHGWIGVFDNNDDRTTRGSVLGGSRIVALQPHTDSLRVLFPTDESDPFHSGVGGKWQLLENGNLLLTESTAGRIVEVSPDGRTVWEWIHAPFNERQVAEVLGGTRYDLTPEQVAAWPCSPDAASDAEPEGAYEAEGAAE